MGIGEDPKPFIDQAEDAGSLAAGSSPVPRLRRSAELLERAAEINPNSMQVLAAQATTALMEVRWLLREGRSPAAPLGTAETALDRAREIDAEWADGYLDRAELERWRAEWRLAAGDLGGVAAAAERGLAAAAKAFEIQPHRAQARILEAELRLLRARSLAGEERREEVAAARKALVSARELNPLFEAEIEAIEGRLDALL